MKNILIFGLILLGIYWLSSSSSDGNYSSYPDYPDEYDSGSSYEDYDEPITRDNWVCTEDCSGHEAGYEWAEENDITDPYDCGGNSDSFIEGCEAYANEYQMQEEEDYEDYYEEDNYGY